MNGFWTLTKLNIKNILIPKFDDAKQKKKYFLMIALLCICFLSPLIMIVVGINQMTKAVATINMITELLSIVFLMTQIMVLFFGTISYLQIMYFSKDNEILAPLPIRTNVIFMSRLLLVILSELIVTACVIIPTTIVMAVTLAEINMPLSASFYVLIPFAVVFIPFVPILLISIVSFPLMKIVSYIKKHPTFSSILSATLCVGIFVAIYVPIIKMNGEQGEFSPSDMAEALKPMLNIGTYYFPTYSIACAMMNKSIAINLLIFFGTNIVGFAVAVGISVLLYRSIITQILEGGSMAVSKKFNSSDKTTSQNKAFVFKELKMIVRDQNFAVSTFVTMLMLPAMILIFNIIFSKSMVKGSDGGATSIMLGNMQMAISLLFGCMMLGGSNNIASIAFSRENKQFYLLKTLPISAKNIVKSKIMVADIVTIITALLTTIAFVFSSKAGIIDKLLYFFVITIFACSINAYAVKRDLKNPKLKWMNIKEITNRNFSTIVPVLIGMIGAFAMFITFMVVPSALKGWGGKLLCWVIVAIILTLYYFLMRYKKSENCEQYLENIE